MAVVPRPLRRRTEPEAATRTALRALVAAPKFELVPLKNALDQAAFLPPGALVSVTASPAKGMDATIDLSSRLHERGYVVVPHLSAHMIRDRAHLAELLGRMRDGGIDRAFVVGGDAEDPGEFRDGLSLLRAMADIGHGLRLGDDDAHPLLRAEKFRDDGSEEGVDDRHVEARENIRRRVRQLDDAVGLQAARRQRPHQVDLLGLDRAQTGKTVDHHREEGE